MKRNQICIIQELMVTQMNFLIFYPLTLTIAELVNVFIPAIRPSLALWSISGLLPFVFYVLRKKVRYTIILIFLQILSISMIYFLPWGNSINRNMALICEAGFAFYSVYLHLTTEHCEEKRITMPFAVSLAAISLYLQHYLGNYQWDSYYKFALIMVFILYFMHYYISEYRNFLIVNSSSTEVLPEKEIFYSGLKQTASYTLFGALILLLTSQFNWLLQILSWFKQLFVRFLIFIFSMFPSNETKITEMPIEEKKPIKEALFQEAGDLGEPALIWKVLEVLLFIAFGIFVAFVCIWLLKKLFRLLKNTILGKTVKTEHSDELTKVYDVREKCDTSKKVKTKKKNSHFFGFPDSKERIRRIYKKKAMAYRPSPLSGDTQKAREFTPEKLRFYTAKELEQEMKADHFSAIYEKARYSNDTCSSQDVKRMKELCR